ncbi:hypothetical protein CEXT_127821, partial [Caerostris extrusa]
MDMVAIITTRKTFSFRLSQFREGDKKKVFEKEKEKNKKNKENQQSHIKQAQWRNVTL